MNVSKITRTIFRIAVTRTIQSVPILVAFADAKLFVSPETNSSSTADRVVDVVADAGNITRRTTPIFIAKTFFSRRVSVDANSSTSSTLRTGFALLTKFGVISCAVAVEADFRREVVVALFVIAGAIPNVARAGNVAGLSSPTWIADARGVAEVGVVAATVSRTDLIRPKRAVELASCASKSGAAVAVGSVRRRIRRTETAGVTSTSLIS